MGPSISHCGTAVTDPQLAFAIDRTQARGLWSAAICLIPSAPHGRLFGVGRTDGSGRTTEAKVDAAWVLNVAAAIGKRTSKARVLREEQQPRLNGLSPVLCWRSRSTALRARTVVGALLPSIERLSSWSPPPHGSRSLLVCSCVR